MRSRPALVAIVAALATLFLTGCGSSGHSASATSTSPPTSTDAAATSTASTTSVAATSTTIAPSSTSTTATSSTTVEPAVQNVTVTAAVRASLLAAGAAYHELPVSDYVGLMPGDTYYAFDSANQSYWAGASLDPSPNSIQAQVSGQDDGAYLLFMEPAGGTWTVWNVGLAGVGAICPTTPPPAIVALWGWPTGSCRPASYG